MPEAQCAAVVLAAGASTRLGQPKQLLPYHGESLLRRTVRAALEAGCLPVIVVLGHASERMREEVADLPVLAVDNPDWQSGMGSSLRRGVQAVLEQEPAPGDLLLLVSDQRCLSAEVLHSLLAVHARGNRCITAAQYSGRLGVPAVFSMCFSGELMRIEGDQGARRVIDAHAPEVTAMDWPEGALDIDTASDAERMREEAGRVG